MPKEAFGGDDSEGGAAPDKKKLGLGKFGLSPDANIRDVFWRIMGSYAAAKKADKEISGLENDRFALMRVALAVLSSPDRENYGLAPKFIAAYSIMMMVDGGWNDALSEFLERACERKLGVRKDMSFALRKLILQERYGAALIEQFAAMVRARATCGIALEYISEMESPELARSLKRELIIIARGDIGTNQLNAIKAISFIKEEDDIKKSLLVLLSHWDAQARQAAAEVLVGMAGDRDVKAAAEKRLAAETDPNVKKMLGRIAGAGA